MSLEIMASPAEAAGLLTVGMAIGGLAVRGYMKSLLHDEGHRAYIAPDFEALQAVVEVCSANGLEPSREITDEKVVQALMDDNSTVFLVPRQDMWEDMGEPTAAPMLRVKDPVEAAEKAQVILVEKGYTAEVLNPLSDQLKGQMRFVKTDALRCGLIGFREHVVKMGSRPPKWRIGKLLGFTPKTAEA